MKTASPLTPSIYFCLLLCCLFFSPVLFSQANFNAGAPDMVEKAMQQKDASPSTLPTNATSEWYSKATAYLAESEYNFRPFGKPGNYSAANHAQHLGFLITPSGYTVKNFREHQPENDLWEYNFTVKKIGKEHNLAPLTKVKEKNCSGRSLEYVYNDYSIQYTNTELGLQQDFTIHTKPAGGGNLQVVIGLEGDLDAAIVNHNELMLYADEDISHVKMRYDRLKVWDAHNRWLQASMHIDKANRLVISVDDKDAIYPVTIDPLNHLPDWSGSGQGLLFPLLNDVSAHVLYGYSVSSAGDVNGDGISDIIIGVPAYVSIISIAGNTFNPAPLGAAFIYYGSLSGPSVTPSEVLQPSLVTGALAGFSVSSAGDINNDGKADVIVSAPGDNINLTVVVSSVSVSTGKVYVYSGASFDGNINTTPAPAAALSLTQPDFGILAAIPANPLFGYSVSAAGDVNGDGFADIIVGSPAYFDLGSLTLGGRVDIYHGSASGISTTPNRVIKGGLLNGLFGFSVSTAGKVNNDIYSDIIVGSPASVSILGVGAAFIFHGSATGITATSTAGANTTLQAPGLLNKTLFGYSVSNAGDVNGDGKDDVIVGEPLSLVSTLSLQVVAVGAAHIFYGSNSGIITAGVTHLTSPRDPNILGSVQGNLLYGYSVSAAGDMNCDGLADVIIGEPGGSAISLGTGALGIVSANAISGSAYVYAGKMSTGPLNNPLITMQETAALSVANLLGASVKIAGDVNGDGHPDIIVGAPNGTLNLSSSLTGIVGNAVDYLTVNSVGSAYVWYGCALSLLPVQLLSFEGKEQADAAVLQWTVTGAEKTTRFDIERSIDGRSFSRIGTVPAVMANGNTGSYSFTDYMLMAHNNYYRLKLIDADGKTNYSKTVLVLEDLNVKNSMRVAPNPARERILVHFTYLAAGNYTLIIVNALGQPAYTEHISITSNFYQTKTIARTSGMTNGTYFLRLINKDGQAAGKGRVVLE